ncbi:MAG: HEAT repeat domain-containing protein [Nitrososphaerota archaeon]
MKDFKVDEALRKLHSSNPADRERAATLLGDSDDKRAVDYLIKALEREENKEVVGAIINALGKLGDPRAIESIQKFSEDERRIELWNDQQRRYEQTTISNVVSRAVRQIQERRRPKESVSKGGKEIYIFEKNVRKGESNMIVAFIGGSSAGKTVAGYLLEQATTIHANVLQGIDMSDREILPPGEGGKLDEWIHKNLSDLRFTRFIPSDSALHFQRIESYFIRPEWPPGTGKDEFQRVTLTLRAEGGILRRPREYEVSFYEIGGEKIREIYEKVTSGTQYWRSWDEKLLTLLRSEVFVLLVPSDICRDLPTDEKGALELREKRSTFDWETTRLLAAIHNYREFSKTPIRAMGVLFTKHDAVCASLPLNTDDDYDKAFSHIDEAYAQLQDIVRRHGIKDKLKYFKSGIRTQLVEGMTRELPALGRTGKVEFYVREYLKLLRWLVQL